MPKSKKCLTTTAMWLVTSLPHTLASLWLILIGTGTSSLMSLIAFLTEKKFSAINLEKPRKFFHTEILSKFYKVDSQVNFTCLN